MLPDTDSRNESNVRSMSDTLRERREETWQLLCIQGLAYSDVCERIASKYDCKVTTIETDISRMDRWLPKLDFLSAEVATDRLRELKTIRQRLQRMAAATDDLHLERLLLQQAEQSIERDIRISQTLGEVDTELGTSLTQPDSLTEVVGLVQEMHQQAHSKAQDPPDAPDRDSQ